MGSTSPNTMATALPGAGTSYAVHSADIHERIVQQSMTTLTAAQIIAMNGTPVSLLPAVAGKAYVIQNIEFRFNAGTVAFTGGGAVTVAYSGGAAVANTLAANQITSATQTDNVKIGIDAVAAVNTAITITNATAAFAAGNGTLTVSISYRLV